MTKPAKYSIKKTAAEIQEKDRFYLSGSKYCVTNKPLKDIFGRVLITFIKVDGSPIKFCDLHVPENFPFMVLTGQSGIGETAYDELEKLRANDKAEPGKVQTVTPVKKQVLDIVLATEADAEEVLERLFQMIVKYDVASVGDLYDAVGLNGTYEDTKWGWANLAGSGVSRVRSGYMLVLPKPVPVEGVHS
jgi:hypothetical protein